MNGGLLVDLLTHYRSLPMRSARAFDHGYWSASCAREREDAPADDMRRNWESGWDHYQAEMAGAMPAHDPQFHPDSFPDLSEVA